MVTARRRLAALASAGALFVASLCLGAPEAHPPERVRARRLATASDDDLLAVADDPRLLPRPPRSWAAQTDEPYQPYSLANVLQSAPLFHDVFAVLVFDPPTDTFVAHYSNSMRWVSGCHKLVGSLKVTINSLRIMFPERFNSEAPEFALAVSSGDYPGLNWNDCLREGRGDCLVDDRGNELQLAPILHYGSVFRQPILPSLIAMPMPQNNHLWCYHSWALSNHLCRYYLPRSKDNPIGLVFREQVGVGWDELIPQVVWRGTDFSYLHKMNPSLRPPDFERDVAGRIDRSEGVDRKIAATQAMRQVYDELIPRWKGVVWTAEADQEAEANDQQKLNQQRRAWNGQKERRQQQQSEQIESAKKAVPWCNIKFAASMHNGKKTPTKEIESYLQFEAAGIPAAGEGMSLEELGRFKYHVDLGGGGGTTWSGTLEKLGLPGLLFHHETPTIDYIHEALEPWVHYIPVKTDLSDLKERFEWAEAHPKMAKQISDNATQFARRLGTPEGMAELFDRFYGGPLRKVIEAYRPLEARQGGSWQDVMQAMMGDDMRPIMRCRGYHQHDCDRLVDDLHFTRRDAGESKRKS